MTGAIAPADIGIIVLAAGTARRFGADKRRAPLPAGQTLLEATLSRVPRAISRRILVLREGDDDLAHVFRQDWRICIAGNPDAGMANSLASGIAMAGGWAGALIGLGDMPYITAATYSMLQQALATHDIVIPVCKGERGNPVGFRHNYFAEMATLEGDRGARSLLEKHAQACFVVETGDEGVLRDIDTPENLIS